MYNRQYPATFLKRRTSKFGLGQLIGYTLPTNSLTDFQMTAYSTVEDDSWFETVYKVVELEVSDKETIHLLVFLLLQFLSRHDQNKDKYMSLKEYDLLNQYQHVTL
ncbi:uncharacterized protein LOC106640271 [Copidosoma floridanum]|uniref:uncharacterized protein LOC106640271 n=1 Tax=Copidosoma floridanum TaxID=29053 RepID=UPI0006C9BB3A|nr:uncharacterized protein LOC106640271 [Copidosoma floridanum]